MRNWDLVSPGVKLEDALRKLKAVRDDVRAQWSDQTRQQFEETYLVPLEAKVKRALDAIKRMSDVTSQAHHDCDEQNL